MVLRVIQRGEVVEVVLDLGAFHHPVTEADHYVLDQSPRPGDRVEVSDRTGRGSGQGHIDPVIDQSGIELCRSKFGATLFDLRLESLSGPVGSPTYGPTLGRFKVSDSPEDLSQFGLASEPGDPDLFEFSRRSGR